MASEVGERNGEPLAIKGICTQRILQIVSVTTQVVILRRVSQLNSNRGVARRLEGAGGERPEGLLFCWLCPSWDSDLP